MRRLTLLLLIIPGLMLFSGCKSQGTAIIKITVVDDNNHAVPDATVTIKNESNNILGSGTTDMQGLYVYEHAHASTHPETLKAFLSTPDDDHDQGYAGFQIIAGDEVEITIKLD